MEGAGCILRERKGPGMAEEFKQQENKARCARASSTIFKVILGLLFLALGSLAIIKWKDAVWTLISGGIGLFFFLVGAIILVVAK